MIDPLFVELRKSIIKGDKNLNIVQKTLNSIQQEQSNSGDLILKNQFLFKTADFFKTKVEAASAVKTYSKMEGAEPKIYFTLLLEKYEAKDCTVYKKIGLLHKSTACIASNKRGEVSIFVCWSSNMSPVKIDMGEVKFRELRYHEANPPFKLTTTSKRTITEGPETSKLPKFRIIRQEEQGEGFALFDSLVFTKINETIKEPNKNIIFVQPNIDQMHWSQTEIVSSNDI